MNWWEGEGVLNSKHQADELIDRPRPGSKEAPVSGAVAARRGPEDPKTGSFAWGWRRHTSLQDFRHQR